MTTKNQPGSRKHRAAKTKSTRPVGPVIAPAIISRVPTFQPTFRRGQPRGMDATWTTPWGSVRVAGRLTEIHRKVLDAIFSDNEGEFEMETGAKAFLVDPYRLAKAAQVGQNTQWLKSIMEDMRVAVVHIVDTHTGLEHHAGIVSEYLVSSQHASQPGGALTGDRSLMVATISAAWMRIHHMSLTVHYRNLLPIVNTAQHGATHALALHVLSNATYNRALVQALTDIGALREGMTDRGQRKVIAEVLEEQKLLAVLGIQIGANRVVYYHQHAQVTFANPTGTET